MGSGSRQREKGKEAVTFLHGLINEPFQFLGLVVLGLCLQQPSHILQGLFIFLPSGKTHPLPQYSVTPPAHQRGSSLPPSLQPHPME